MRKILSIGFPLLLGGALLCGVAAAQSGKLARVSAAGSKKYSSAQIAEASGLKPGDNITKEDIQGAADRLAQLGPFQNVRYRFETRDGVELEFQVEDAASAPVSFDNFVTFTDAELNDALKQAVPFYDGTAPEQGAMLDAMTAALEKLLESRGVKAGLERAVLLGPADEGNIVQFRIAAPAMKVKAVEFGDPELNGLHKLAEPLTVLVGKPFSRFATEVFLIEQVRPIYAQRGNLKVRFGVPQVRFTGNPNRPLPDEVNVYVPVEPGPAYKFGGVTWSGNTLYDAVTLNSFLGIAAGVVADGMKLTAAWDRVKREYGRKGYLDASITPQQALDDAHATATFRAVVAEGRQYHMGRMQISGLSVTAERKLLEVWQLEAGQVFDQTYFEDFLEKQAEKKGAFGEYVVTYTTVEHMLRTDPKTGTVDVLLNFK